MVTTTSDQIVRATGLLVIEVRNSNPNGDPDQEGDPRQRSHDQRGWISGVSFKRKLRDLVENKEGPVWQSLNGALEPKDFQILESRSTIRKEVDELLREPGFPQFKSRYWDARIFGNTFLEKDGEDSIRSGVAQFGVGYSVAPVRIERATTTKLAPAQEGKSRGMAPLGHRVVEHGVYCMPFFVNPTAATRSGCERRDVDLMLRLIPYAYSHTASSARPFVGIRHAWYIEHRSPLGSCSDFALIDALTPTKMSARDEPSASWAEYDVPTSIGELQARVSSVRDLMEEM